MILQVLTIFYLRSTAKIIWNLNINILFATLFPTDSLSTPFLDCPNEESS